MQQAVTTEQLKFRIALTLIEGVGNVNARSLVAYCGSVEAIFKEKKRNLEKIPGIGPTTAQRIHAFDLFDKAEKECSFIERHNIQSLFYLDQAFPWRLKNCTDAPVMLYYKGIQDLNHQRLIAIVGTRNASEYGKQVTEKITEDLKAYDVVIVSGLAYGIDITAHKTALKNEMNTIGVVAHGLDRIYPAVHKATAEQMIEQGGLLTEFITNTKPDRENFPQRNRIVAGICDAVVVIEAARSGGALITADIANSYNRDVFAVPGRTSDTYSQGCNHFIKINKAALAESAADIAYMMGWEIEKKVENKTQQRQLFIELDGDEKTVYNFISQNGKSHIDLITGKVSLPVSKLSATLLSLEFKGLLKSLPGKMYESA
ncbi:MAG: DNA-processing protein DprA [Bacteroidia bacterium]|nr:DNA-processing protein DprA [Bacteroidia bacterium]